ncbi:Tropinesterase [Tsuneonella dongtanensis]|uniref:Tropinesterase n=1 Tax=Tsuneonella dongtanensis TaxID=692370 RepID=A0A1B2A9A3_9SPHN|nr:alpha/beta fold hydrolase [Tsuneonella dongtanensis]ANY18658.1 Tropinesterase [Tsuneonella dongtanensis]
MIRWLSFFWLLVALPAAAVAEPADRSRFIGRSAEVTRHFADLPDGQIHFRKAGKAGPHAPVVLLHQSPNSSQIYVEFMAELGRDRQVFAPDTPGFGESDLPAAVPEIADYARTIAKFLESQSLGQVDLLGYHTGAAIAIELARRYPERVRRVILVGIPAFTPEEAAAFEAQPWPTPFDGAGNAVAESWRSTQRWKGPRQSDSSMRRWFDQKIANGPTAWWGARAALRYPTIAALADVKAPILFIRPRDDLWDISLRVLPAIPHAQRLDMPHFGFAVFEAAPEEMADRVRRFFDGTFVP